MNDSTQSLIEKLLSEYPLNVFPEYTPPLPDLLVALNGLGRLQTIANGQNRIRGYVLTTPDGDRVPFRISPDRRGYNGTANMRVAMWRYLLTRTGHLPVEQSA